MRFRFSISALVLAVFALALLGGLSAKAQASAANPGSATTSDPASTFSVVTEREPVTSLNGQWRFEPGDGSAWADPHFNDSQWALVNSGDNWNDIGYGHLSGVGWYRFRVTVPAGEETYSLRLPIIYTCYQVFADGKLVLTQGQLPPHARLYHTRPAIVDLATEPRTDPQTILVALRIWEDPAWTRYHPGGLRAAATVGRSDLLYAQENTQEQARLWEYADGTDLGSLELLAFIISLALYLSRRAEVEYLWFSLLAVGLAAEHFVYTWSALHVVPVRPTEQAENLFNLLFLVASLQFYRTLLAGKWTRLFKFALICCGLHFLISLLLDTTGILSAAGANFLLMLTEIPIFLWIVVLIRRRRKEHNRDARLLRVPVYLLLFSLLYTDFVWTLQTAGLAFASHLEIKMRRPLYLTFTDVAEGFFLLAMLAILLSRFGRTRREQDRIESELEAARAMQQVLVPDSLPDLPGLRISTAYHPAEEVGGDFFQVLRMRSGGTLFVLGDVAGKGLPAALAVSLAVGALRTIADYSESPGEVLAALNRRLYGRGPGFTTCLALHLSADRTILTVANAGHIPPYVNGYELNTDANLPLGLDPDATFAERRYLLKVGDYVAALTDGVPEAMKGQELFGFERTHLLSREPAARIAQEARSFGQKDDITVLTIEVIEIPVIEPEAVQTA